MVLTRAEWASPYMRRGRALGELPSYGTPAWCALPADDPRRVASCVVAAECWASELEPERLRQRLEDEIAAQRYVEEKIVAEAWSRASSNVVSISTSRRRGSWERKQGAS
jgi:hypothetical protein